VRVRLGFLPSTKHLVLRSRRSAGGTSRRRVGCVNFRRTSQNIRFAGKTEFTHPTGVPKLASHLQITDFSTSALSFGTPHPQGFTHPTPVALDGVSRGL
jgi:hypothetical protein